MSFQLPSNGARTRRRHRAIEGGPAGRFSHAGIRNPVNGWYRLGGKGMKGPILAILLGCILMLQTTHAQDISTLDGRWTLDRGQSQFPKEIGFTADWLSDAIAADDAANGPAAGGGARSGGPGGRGGGGGGGRRGPVSNRQPPRESPRAAGRGAPLANEVRMPPGELAIPRTPT